MAIRYGGKDFRHEVNADGFTLRCRDKAVDYAEFVHFDFRVAK